MSRLVFAIAALALATVAHAGGNASAGQKKAATVCAACHGPDGNKPSAPDQPILAGQYEDYLARAMADYKNGRRKNAIMTGMVKDLSKQDIADLAAWFASQTKSPLHDQR
jgi:cytochrome c553